MLPKTTIIFAKRGEQVALLSWMLKSPTTQGFKTPSGLLLSLYCHVQTQAGQAGEQMSLCLSSGRFISHFRPGIPTETGLPQNMDVPGMWHTVTLT